MVFVHKEKITVLIPMILFRIGWHRHYIHIRAIHLIVQIYRVLQKRVDTSVHKLHTITNLKHVCIPLFIIYCNIFVFKVSKILKTYFLHSVYIYIYRFYRIMRIILVLSEQYCNWFINSETNLETIYSLMLGLTW